MGDRDNFLDCIRALAVTLVLFTHYRGWMPGGSIGVSIFFCLSGFLICRILIGLPEVSAGNIVKFIFRRFMRVWPLMAFQVFAALALYALLRPAAVSTYAAMVPNLLTFTTPAATGWVGLSPAVLWTLRAEFWFYVSFGIAFYFVGRKYLLVLVVGSIAASWAAKFLLGNMATPATLIYLDQLMYGALCAVIIDASPPWLRYFRYRAMLWGPLAAILLIGCIPFGGYNLIWYSQTGAAAALTGILLLRHAANPVRADLPPIAAVGYISYSVYLMHGIALDAITSGHIVNPQFDAVMIFGLIVGISLLTFRWIELPFIALSKALAPFNRTAAGAPIKSRHNAAQNAIR
jgi:peptidoglycan/LPS O-acetylase OafA/YrhL